MATNPFNLATPLPVETPFLANNGNPNTVYNTEGTVFQNTEAQPLGGAATAAPSPWTPANPPAALPTMPTNSAYSNPATQFWQNYAGVNRPVFDLSQSGAWGTNPFAPPTTTPPTATPPVTTPPTTKPPIDTGPQDPARGGGGGGTGVDRGGGGTQIVVGGFTDSGRAAVGTGDGRMYFTNPAESIINGLRNIVDDASRGLGFNGRDGNFDVNQFVDAVTQVFLPGDLYNANVGRWNTLNVANSLLNSVVPGLGNVAQWLVDKLPEGNPLRSWMQRQILQNNADDAKDPDNFMNAPQTPPPRGGGGEGGRAGGTSGRGGSGWGGSGWGGGGYTGSGNVVIRDIEIV